MSHKPKVTLNQTRFYEGKILLNYYEYSAFVGQPTSFFPAPYKPHAVLAPIQHYVGGFAEGQTRMGYVNGGKIKLNEIFEERRRFLTKAKKSWGFGEIFHLVNLHRI